MFTFHHITLFLFTDCFFFQIVHLILFYNYLSSYLYLKIFYLCIFSLMLFALLFQLKAIYIFYLFLAVLSLSI